MVPVDLAVSGQKPFSWVGVEVFDARYSTEEMGAVVGVVAPVLGLRTMTDSVMENGLELVVLASVNIWPVVYDQAG